MQPFTIFISYRREDSAAFALLLKHEMEKRWQFVRVLVDVEDIPPAEPFPQRITRLIESSHAVIPLIGEKWMPTTTASATAAKMEGNDWVEEELYQALTKPMTRISEEDRCGLSQRLITPLFVGIPQSFSPFALSERIAEIRERNALWIDHANWSRLIGPLLDDLAVVFDVRTRPDKDEYPDPDPRKASTQPINAQELLKTLEYQDYAGWYLDNFGNAEATYLTKIFKFNDFAEATDFMEAVSSYARVLDHQPEWRNVFSQVSVALTTWDARRQVTIYDLNLALYMNRVERRIKNL